MTEPAGDGTSRIGPPKAAPAQRLWQLWRQGQQPDVLAFLAHAGDLKPEQVAAVLLVDQRERWRLGERVPAENYLDLFPHLQDDFEYGLGLFETVWVTGPDGEEVLKPTVVTPRSGGE